MSVWLGFFPLAFANKMVQVSYANYSFFIVKAEAVLAALENKI